MNRNLNWNKGIFDSSYQLFENNQFLCSFNFDNWRSSANAKINNLNYFFNNDGLFSSSTKIFDANTNLLGMISFDWLKSSASIMLTSGEQYSVQFSEIWNSKWLITNFKDKQIHYSSQTSSGYITSNTTDDLMLLIGLYVREQYTKNFIFLILIAVIVLPMFLRTIF